MRYARHALFGTAIAAVLTACGGAVDVDGRAGGATDATSAAPGVPDGVAAQYATLQKEIAAEGGEQTSGPWNIGYIVEPAEPWYETRDGKQVFRPVAPGETHHLEIVAREAATGRVVPNVPVKVEVVAADGSVVQTKELQPFYAEFFHYANNFSVPTPGTYTLRATVEAPTFLRHGEEGEDAALSQGATVSFPGVKLEHDGESKGH